MSRAKVDLVIEGRTRDIGGHAVLRALPVAAKRAIGPFVFLDHMGPTTLPPGGDFDVRPHPHIGLSTVTYLFEGEILHRDSLGSLETIRRGDVNWMTAGRGIVHSERTPEHVKVSGGALHGLQIWVALPRERETCEPGFQHYDASALPEHVERGARARVVAGWAFGLRSPVKTSSALFFVDVELEAGAEVTVPEHYAERGVYVVEGRVDVAASPLERASLAVLSSGAATVRAERPSRVAIFGGEALDGPRLMDWNFVATRRELIDRARDDWRERRFPSIPGDDVEFVPLPDWPR